MEEHGCSCPVPPSHEKIVKQGSLFRSSLVRVASQAGSPAAKNTGLRVALAVAALHGSAHQKKTSTLRCGLFDGSRPLDIMATAAVTTTTVAVDDGGDDSLGGGDDSFGLRSRQPSRNGGR